MIPLRALPDPFIAGLISMIFLAWLVPGLGMGDYNPNLGTAIDVGVFMIFFLYGLKLDPEKIRQGMRNWKMHFAIQATTFVLFPLLVSPFYPLLKGTEYEVYWIAVFYLAVLPSTVSSSVVMVSMAGGNIPGAIFNASISGMIGILVTPFLMGLILSGSGERLDVAGIVVQMVVQIILPVILGLFLHPLFKGWIRKRMKLLSRFDQLIILLIVYESFSKSFMSGMFTAVKPVALLILLVVAPGLFFVVFRLTSIMGHKLRFSREDMITFQYAGTKKSLVHGSVFAAVLFAGYDGAGLFLLPIMIYHAFQLFYISIVARREGRIREQS